MLSTTKIKQIVSRLSVGLLRNTRMYKIGIRDHKTSQHIELHEIIISRNTVALYLRFVVFPLVELEIQTKGTLLLGYGDFNKLLGFIIFHITLKYYGTL